MDVFVLGHLGAGHKAGGNGEEEQPTEQEVVLMHEVFQLPSGALCRLIAPSLTLAILFNKPDKEWLLATEIIDINYEKERYIPQWRSSLSLRLESRTLGCLLQP